VKSPLEHIKDSLGGGGGGQRALMQRTDCCSSDRITPTIFGP
jgi:hypothetical protein